MQLTLIVIRSFTLRNWFLESLRFRLISARVLPSVRYTYGRFELIQDLLQILIERFT
jgi:hypothetical protein